MGAHIGALIVKEFAVDGEQAALRIDCGAYVKMLLPRVIGGEQMLAPVFDPLHRPSQPQRGEADENVLGVEFAAYAEAAADVAFVQMHRRGRAAEHARQRVAVPMRHLGGAVQFEDAARFARYGAARLHRHAAMTADGEIEFDDRVRGCQRRFDIAEALAHQGDLGRMVLVECAGRCVGR